MRDKFTIYDHERWEPNPHWGRPLRFLTRHVDINEGNATNPPPASWGLPAALTLKSECFWTPDGERWEHHSGATVIVTFVSPHTWPRRCGRFVSVGHFEAGNSADEFDFEDAEPNLPRPSPEPPEVRYWQEVRVSGDVQSCFPRQDPRFVHDQLLMPGACLEAIVANQTGSLPGWRPGWYSGGRILALHFASAEPLPDVQSPF
jgi:hypothetical protein